MFLFGALQLCAEARKEAVRGHSIIIEEFS
jgi:hypothetical protein